MGNNILQKLLDRGMLVEIGEDDDRYNALIKTSQELADILIEHRDSIINHTLVALDPNIPLDEPVLEEVEDLLKKHWKLMRNRFPDRPRELLRAIILEALYSVGNKDSELAAIIWLSGSSFFPYANLGREVDFCRDLLTIMGDLGEALAVKEWTNLSDYDLPKIPTLKIKLPQGEVPSVDKEMLTNFFAAAAGPNTPAGALSQNLNPNPNWPNTGQPWSHEFAPRAATGVAQTIDQISRSLVNLLSTNLNQLDTQINKYFSGLESKIVEILNNSTKSSIIAERRTNLLWWKETLYSPTARESYRKLRPTIAVIAMAFDLYNQVPAIYPASVDFLLRETVRDLFASNKNSDPETISLTKFFDEIALVENQEVLKKLFAEPKEKKGRIPLISFIQTITYNKIEPGKDIPQRIGLSSEQELSLSELSVWCFHDLQAQKLASLKEG